MIVIGHRCAENGFYFEIKKPHYCYMRVLFHEVLSNSMLEYLKQTLSFPYLNTFLNVCIFIKTTVLHVSYTYFIYQKLITYTNASQGLFYSINEDFQTAPELIKFISALKHTECSFESIFSASFRDSKSLLNNFSSECRALSFLKVGKHFFYIGCSIIV